jgi:hypothetical protein
MEIAYVYTKVRTEFGKDVKPAFSDEPADVMVLMREPPLEMINDESWLK